MNLAVERIARLLIVAIAITVVIQLVPVIRSQWSGGDGCPVLWLIPACYLIALCYLVMAVVSAIGSRSIGPVFWVAWFPVFLLAGAGTTMELSGRGTCPVSGAGVPLCYYSLAVAIVLASLFLIATGVKSSLIQQ